MSEAISTLHRQTCTLVKRRGYLHLSSGPKENYARPAIDPLFRSAALAYGESAAGVILTGGLDDGSAGLVAIKRMGGIAIVQDPMEAEVPSMPQNALRYADVDYCLQLAELPALLVRLTSTAERIEAKPTLVESMHKNLEIEVAVASNEAVRQDVEKLGSPSIFACPECHGTLLRMDDASPPRFRCHTGHAYTMAALAESMSTEIEDTMWSAIRSLEEYARLLREISDKYEDGEGDVPRVEAARAMEKAATIRGLLRGV